MSQHLCKSDPCCGVHGISFCWWIPNVGCISFSWGTLADFVGCQLPEICPQIACTYLDILCKWMIKCSTVLACPSCSGFVCALNPCELSAPWNRQPIKETRSRLSPGGLYEESGIRQPSGWAKTNLSNTFCLPASVLGRAGEFALLRSVWSCSHLSRAAASVSILSHIGWCAKQN